MKTSRKLNIRNIFVMICCSALLAFFGGLTSFHSIAAEQQPKRVFVLNSFNRGYTWTDNMLRGIDDAFGSSGMQIDTFVTFMDMKRVPATPEYFLRLRDLIREGYKGMRFDAVMACDNDALEFLRQYRDELFPGTPIVFVSINDFSEQMLDGREDITGTSENTDYAGTINLALKLRPQTKNIVVVIDATTTGKAHLSAVEKIQPEFLQRLTFTYLSFADLTLDELAQKLAALSNDSVVLLLQHFVDKNGTSHTVQQSTPVLTASASVPVFVLTDIRMGLGALGGHVVSGYAQGEAAAQMVVKILNGVNVSDILVLLDSPNKYMFDYKVMQRFNISESALPPGSILINKPVSILDEYRNELWAILGVFIVLCGVLVYLLFEIRRRKKIEQALTRTRISVDAASDALFWMTPDARIVDVNASACSSLGYTRSELLKLRVPDVDVHYTDEVWKQHFPELREHGTLMFETEHRAKDGRVFPVEIVANYVKFGEEERNCAFVRDITERKRAEEELIASETRFRQIINVSPMPLALNDEKQQITFLNNAFVQTFGYTLDEIPTLAVWWPKAYPDSEYRQWVAETWQAELERAKQTGTVFSPMEIRIRCKNGTDKITLASATSIINSFEGNHLVLLMDITERKQAENQILKMNIELERRVIERTAQLAASNKELEAFAYSVSHDLRAPLRAMEGFSTALLSRYSEQLDEQGRHYLDRIQLASQRMGQLINDLLNLSRITRSELANQRVDLSQLANEIITDLKTRDLQRQVEFVLADSLIVQGDSHLLRIALQNLLENAWKFSSTRPVASIEVGQMTLVEYKLLHGTDDVPPEIQNLKSNIYFVRDNGVGFDMAFMDKLFAPFQRLHAMHEFPGSGIGLAIVQRIIVRHGGRVWPSAQEGQGATFYFTIGGAA